MEEYTAEDGLRILRYLDIERLSKSETKMFREMWKEAYKHLKKPILTTKVIYTKVLPYAEDNEYAGEISDERDRDFTERLKWSKLDSIVDSGVPLKKILEFADFADKFKRVH